MLPDEVRKAVEAIEFCLRGAWEPQSGVHASFAAIKAHLLAREAEVERLRAIEKERWGVVATRNAAVMRAERAEALLREALQHHGSKLLTHPPIDPWEHYRMHARITAHLSENSHDA